MKKLCLFILSVLIIVASGCNKADTDDSTPNNGSKQSVAYDSGEQKKEHIGSKFMGIWYYTGYSDPQYAEDFEKIKIVPYGENKAKVLWGDGEENVFEITSEDKGVGPCYENNKVIYYVDTVNGREHFGITVAEGGELFQPGAGGYRTVPSSYEPKAEKEEKQTTGSAVNETVARLKSPNNVWQCFSSNTEIPEYELIIERVSNRDVVFSLLAYRIDSFSGKHGTINNDGTISFNNISGTIDNAALSGTIAVNDGNIVLIVTDSSHPYIEKGQRMVFANRTAVSALQ